MEAILAFVTPGPLSEKCRFSTRVLTSWLSLGLILGLILGIVAISSSPSDPTSAFLGCLFGIPILLCTFGLIGLGVSSLRGDENYHSGWYWYIFPVAMYVLISLWVGLGIFAFIVALTGGEMPNFNQRSNRNRSPEIDPNKFKEETENKKFKEFLEDFHEQLDQMRKLEDQGKLNSKQEKVVRKLRSFDPSKYESRLSDVFDEEEMLELILLLLMLLGVEVR
jgi:ABC-type transport system involved in multi-copper enzyme maturation permease subunit